jgi:surfeit locus 1 family protein
MPPKRITRRFWLVLIATLVSVSITASLGFWQLRRAAQKLEIEADIQVKQMAAVLSNTDIKTVQDLGGWTNRVAVFSGTWVADATVFLDNRQMDGRQGFYVVTPLKLTGDGRWVLVQRGWAPRDFLDRSRLPKITTPAGEVAVYGRIAVGPGKVYELGEAGTGPIRQNLDAQTVALEHSATVLNGSLVQLQAGGDTSPDGLLRNWPPIASGVDKHHGYAFQWFGLCALILILYVWFQILSPLRRAHHRSTAP